MNTTFHNLNRIQDLARCRADRLRSEAMDDFWRAANGLLAVGTDWAGRKALRLADRLSRRERGRSTRTSTLPFGV